MFAKATRHKGQVEDLEADQLRRCPPWAVDQLHIECAQCCRSFNLIRRRHHCRNCGKLFCDACSQGRQPLPLLGYLVPVRVCNTCTQALADGAAEGLPGLVFDNPAYRVDPPPAYVAVPERVWPGTAADAEVLEDAALRAYDASLHDPDTHAPRSTNFDQTPVLARVRGDWFRAPTGSDFASPISPRPEDAIAVAAARRGSDPLQRDRDDPDDAPEAGAVPADVTLGPWHLRVAIVRLHVPRGTAAAAHKPGVRTRIMTFVAAGDAPTPPLAMLSAEDEPVVEEEQEVDPTTLPREVWDANAHLFVAMTPRMPVVSLDSLRKSTVSTASRSSSTSGDARKASQASRSAVHAAREHSLDSAAAAKAASAVDALPLPHLAPRSVAAVDT